MHFQLNNLLRDTVVPFEVKVVGFIVRSFGIDYVALPNGMMANGIKIRMSWNCLGWQSLVLFIISLIFGLRGNSYTKFSKAEAIILGLFGLFWMNILRISATVLLAVNLMSAFRIIFHDYLSAIMTIIFLLLYWWFSYTFVLEEKDSDLKRQVPAQPSG